MNYKELEDWCADARRSVEREMDRLQEQQLAMGNHLRVLEAAGELLADTFTIEDAKRIRRQQGMDTERAYSMILNWKSRKYIYQISDISFEKLKYKVKNN